MINWIIAGFHMWSSKIHTGEFSMLLSFFFHEVLEQLKTNIQQIFTTKGFFVVLWPQWAWISKLLRDGAFLAAKRAIKNKKVEEMTYMGEGEGILLCEQLSYSRKSITLMFMSSSRDEFTLS